ncbi:hypothetical protein Q5752_000333 [Cryptotrichosporon argae]
MSPSSTARPSPPPSPPDTGPVLPTHATAPSTPSSSRAPTPDLRASLAGIFTRPARAGPGPRSARSDDRAGGGAGAGARGPERYVEQADERTRLLRPARGDGWDTPGDTSRADVSGFSALIGGASDRAALPGGGERRQSVKKAVKTIRQRSKYYVPAMSYANGLAKLTPVAGIWSAAIPAFMYGALGTCRQLSLGPEAALSLLIGQMAQEAVYGDPHSVPKHPELEAAAISVITTFQIGVITSVLGLLRLGFLDVVLSRALLRGFITAVVIIIFIEQLVPMLGLAAALAASPNPAPHSIPKLGFVLSHVRQLNAPTAILSFSTLAFLILARVVKARIVGRQGWAWTRFVPEILIAVASTTALNAVFRWDLQGVEVLGEISGGKGLPFGLPLYHRTIKYFNYTLPTAFVSAVVGVVDSIVAARENAARFGYPVSPNRELVALGAANLSASIMTGTGALPAFGSLTRSRLNAQAGSRSQMASLITASLMILSVFFLLPSFYFLPKAVLAAIITLVVYAILAEAPHEIAFFWRMRAWTDFAQMTGTFFLTLFFSIELGLVASVGFSLLLVIQNSTKPRIKIIGRLPETDEWVPVDEDEAAQEELPGVLVVRIRESLSFANTGQLKERLRRLELYGMGKSHPSDAPRRENAKAIILHVGDVDEIDASATQILYELVKAYTERGVGIYFAHLHAAHRRLFEIVGITDDLGDAHFPRDLRSAMQEVERLGYGTTVGARY